MNAFKFVLRIAELLQKPASVTVHEFETMDAMLFVAAPDNTRSSAAIPSERMGALQAAYRPANKRMMNHDIPWVACQYPTAALAQEAGLSSEDFAQLLYGSVLLDGDPSDAPVAGPSVLQFPYVSVEKLNAASRSPAPWSRPLCRGAVSAS